ncbi:MAPEG family protein [Bacterioplanoides sp.]|uniref:MAPEG family protein n=1 Tax=Bacterioplanoides sp. TaxID=2066072 RepID=UPI003AFF725F
MTTEVLSLYVFCATIFFTIFAQAMVTVATTNFAYVSGNRDVPLDNPSPVLGRLERAIRNSIEAAVVFVPLVFIATQAGVSNEMTQWSAMVFAASRVLYVITYALGIVGARTIIWNVAATALGIFGAGILLG